MAWPLKRYGFAAAIVAGLGLMAAVVAGKSLLDGGDRAAAASGPAGAAKGGPGGEAPGVRAAAAERHTFTDAVQAIGTAQARESIVITPKVADTIRAIRFESGQRVRRGAVLVELASVEQAADVAEARAAREAAERELVRYQDLFDQGFLPRARLDSAQAAFDAADARLQAGLSRIADRTIRAPFAGVTGLRTASPGQYARPGDSIGTLDDISLIKLDFDVAETHLSRLQPGVAIVARTAAFPDVAFEGEIENVDSRVDAQTRTVRVRAILPNREERLRPGMLMTVEVRSNPRDALAVPENAIIDEADGAYVFVAAPRDGGHAAVRTRVQTGLRVGGMVEITGGLAEGRLVVVEGVQRVRPNQPVRLISENQTPTDAGPAPAAPLRGRS
ncbi:MAG: efflux RND transporter periplasmic adaptor subunit [Alphaproteobacteria bacterium]|nr:efflux RND transporter periplasmic adaptor subunit [Alphaproteobacteria bacterium]